MTKVGPEYGKSVSAGRRRLFAAFALATPVFLTGIACHHSQKGPAVDGGAPALDASDRDFGGPDQRGADQTPIVWAGGDPTVATDLAKATVFLYTGPNARQTAVAAGTINRARAAVLRGQIRKRGGDALTGVAVHVLNRPEYGQSTSQSDGIVGLVVNGDESLTVAYELAGHLPIQRQIYARALDYSWLADVVMTPLDANPTTVDLSSTTMVVVLGSRMSDGNGSRQAALLFRPSTQASIVRVGGATEPISRITVRATEFTVGAEGPNSMPAPLPPGSGYTYALEYSIDEAAGADVQTVRFSQPVIHYVENFLHFPVGGAVPAGYYDRRLGSWIPSGNGRIVSVMSVQAGVAELDSDGDGAADDSSKLAALGVTNDERTQLGSLYKAGQSLWRVPITHFTPWDFNWPFGPPEKAKRPPPTRPKSKRNKKNPCDHSGSIIEAENQALGEAADVVGTPFRLFYRSRLMPGNTAPRTVSVPVPGKSAPDIVKRIEITFETAGQKFARTFPPTTDATTEFTWDGLDAFGQSVQGSQAARVSVGYVYDADYLAPRTQWTQSFGEFSDGELVDSVNSGDRLRAEITLKSETEVTVSSPDMRAMAGFGGWTLDVNHHYDPRTKQLILGDGTIRVAPATADTATLSVVAGTGTPGFSGDGGPAATAQISSEISGLTVAPDGTIYFSDFRNFRIRKVDTGGVIQTLAGTGTEPGLGRPPAPDVEATKENIGPLLLAIAPDGVYFTETPPYRGTLIRKVTSKGVITAIAGYGNTHDDCQGYFGGGWCIDHPFGGDGGPAMDANLEYVDHMVRAADGTIYLHAHSGPNGAQVNRIRRITPDGIIRAVGADPKGIEPGERITGMAVDRDSSIYYSVGNQIKEITTDGRTVVFAGNLLKPQCLGLCPGSDGSEGADVYVAGPRGLLFGPDGNLYFSLASNAIGRLDGNGLIWTEFENPQDIRTDRFVAGQAHNLFFNGTDGFTKETRGRILRVHPILPGLELTDHIYVFPSEDAREIYLFDSTGRHLRTLDGLTGNPAFQFSYDDHGLLIGVTDRDGRVTTIKRDPNGSSMEMRAPSGAVTSITTGEQRYLSSITDPSGAKRLFTYGPSGLMATQTDPRGGVHRFTYDASGGLTKDEQPGGGSWSLSEKGDLTSTEVTLSSGEGRKIVYATTTGGSSSLGAGGLLTKATSTDSAGSTLVTRPDGTIIRVTMAPHPRFGLAAPFESVVAVTTPGNRQHVTSIEKEVTLDPISWAVASETVRKNVNGQAWTVVHTAMDHATVATRPSGRTGTVVLDSKGRVVKAQAGDLEPTTYTYDAAGNLVTSVTGTGPGARTSTWEYDAGGRLAANTDTLGRTHKVVLDQADRLVSEVLPGGAQVAYSYDGNSNVTSITPPGRMAYASTYTPAGLVASYAAPMLTVSAGSTTTTTYNLDRQPASVTPPGGDTVMLRYDGSGRLAAVAARGGTTGYEYSATSGHLTGVTAPGGGKIEYAYDGELLTQSKWTGSVAGLLERGYDNDFRLVFERVNGGRDISYRYDADNLLTGAGALHISRDAKNGLPVGSSLDSLSTQTAYSSFGEPSAFDASLGTAFRYSARYVRDSGGRIEAWTETVGGSATTTTYGYDVAGRLLQVMKDGDQVATYEYDENGNRLSKTTSSGKEVATFDGQDRVLTFGKWSYQYFPGGELSKRTGTNTGAATAYEYDAFGNLRRLTLPNGSVVEYVLTAELMSYAAAELRSYENEGAAEVTSQKLLGAVVRTRLGPRKRWIGRRGRIDVVVGALVQWREIRGDFAAALTS